MCRFSFVQIIVILLESICGLKLFHVIQSCEAMRPTYMMPQWQANHICPPQRLQDDGEAEGNEDGHHCL